MAHLFLTASVTVTLGVETNSRTWTSTMAATSAYARKSLKHRVQLLQRASTPAISPPFSAGDYLPSAGHINCTCAPAILSRLPRHQFQKLHSRWNRQVMVQRLPNFLHGFSGPPMKYLAIIFAPQSHHSPQIPRFTVISWRLFLAAVWAWNKPAVQRHTRNVIFFLQRPETYLFLPSGWVHFIVTFLVLTLYQQQSKMYKTKPMTYVPHKITLFSAIDKPHLHQNLEFNRQD